MNTKNFFGLTYTGLCDWLEHLGEKKAHAKTLFREVYRKKNFDVEAMEGIPKSLYEKKSAFTFSLPKIIKEYTSVDGTKKYVLRLEDGHCIEAVLLHYDHGHALCLSTQKGCRMGCTFCASSQVPFYGNLTAAEIVGEYMAMTLHEGIAIKNIVYMGVGEPLDNADEVLKSLQIFTDDRGLGLGETHITISTSGLVPGIERMTKEKWPCRLAISLHYADDEKRSENMPINKAYPLEQLTWAMKTYAESTGYVQLIEYAVIPGYNDTDEDVENLHAYLKDIPVRINLIALNPIEKGNTPNRNSLNTFKEKLQKKGYFVSKRKALGADIEGACGQLRTRYEEK